jgi:hypothetical protein
MSVKEQILKAIGDIDSPQRLKELLDYIKRLNSDKHLSNRDKVLSLAGTISNKEAVRMKKIIDEEFNNIEGEW